MTIYDSIPEVTSASITENADLLFRQLNKLINDVLSSERDNLNPDANRRFIKVPTSVIQSIENLVSDSFALSNFTHGYITSNISLLDSTLKRQEVDVLSYGYEEEARLLLKILTSLINETKDVPAPLVSLAGELSRALHQHSNDRLGDEIQRLKSVYRTIAEDESFNAVKKLIEEKAKERAAFNEGLFKGAASLSKKISGYFAKASAVGEPVSAVAAVGFGGASVLIELGTQLNKMAKNYQSNNRLQSLVEIRYSQGSLSKVRKQLDEAMEGLKPLQSRLNAQVESLKNALSTLDAEIFLRDEQYLEALAKELFGQGSNSMLSNFELINSLFVSIKSHLQILQQCQGNSQIFQSDEFSQIQSRLSNFISTSPAQEIEMARDALLKIQKISKEVIKEGRHQVIHKLYSQISGLLYECDFGSVSRIASVQHRIVSSSRSNCRVSLNHPFGNCYTWQNGAFGEFSEDSDFIISWQCEAEVLAELNVESKKSFIRTFDSDSNAIVRAEYMCESSGRDTTEVTVNLEMGSYIVLDNLKEALIRIAKTPGQPTAYAANLECFKMEIQKLKDRINSDKRFILHQINGIVSSYNIDKIIRDIEVENSRYDEEVQ